jgi:hypothetical protein
LHLTLLVLAIADLPESGGPADEKREYDGGEERFQHTGREQDDGRKKWEKELAPFSGKFSYPPISRS